MNRKNKTIAMNILNFLAAIIFCLIIWYGAKDLTIPHTTPFGNDLLRIGIILVTILFWLVKPIVFLSNKSAERKLALLVDSNTQIKEKNQNQQKNTLKNIASAFKVLNKRRFLSGKKMQALHKLPWYIVSGPTGYGKTALIKNAGLNFPLMQTDSNSEKINIKGLNFECWITEEAVFLEVSADKNNEFNIQKYNEVWLDVLKTLKRYKHGAPINGVILTVDISYFMGDDEDRKQKAIGTREHIKKIYEQLKLKYPIYILITKADLILGFTEYFENFNVEERDNALGFSFPINETNIANFDLFLSEKFDNLLHKLNQRLPWLLNATEDLNKKFLISLFPQQLFLLRNRIIEVFKEVFLPQKLYEIVDIRGIFFCSATQENGTFYNISGSIINKQFQLSPIKYLPHSSLQQGCFIKNVFENIIIPESSLIYTGNIVDKTSRFFYKFICASALMLVLASLLYHSNAFFSAKSTTLNTEHYLQLFNNNLKNIENNDSTFKQVLLMLAPLKSAKELYSSKISSSAIHPRQNIKIQNALDELTINALHKYLIPLVIKRLESQLIMYQNKPDMLYSTLKAYLFLGNPEHLPKQWLLQAMQMDWGHDAQYSTEERENLNNDLLLSTTNIIPYTLNNSLVSQTIAILKKIPTSERIYDSIKSQIEYSSSKPLELREAMGKNADIVFTKESTSSIPALYTLSGYQKYYLKKLADLVNEVVADQEFFALNNGINNVDKTFAAKDLSAEINLLYGLDYSKAWILALNKLRVNSFNDLNDAVRIVSVLKEPISPFVKLLQLVKTNTNIDNDKIKDVFKDLNRISVVNNNDIFSIEQLSKNMTDLQLFLNKIAQATEPQQLAFTIAKASALGNKNSPLDLLRQRAEYWPDPYRNWLLDVTNNTWHTVLVMAHDYITSAWDSEILDRYKDLSQYYPLNGAAEFDVNQADFANFFKYDGVLNHFFKEYLNPFIDNNHTPWTWLTINGESLSNNTLPLEKLHRMLQVTEYLFPNNSNNIIIKFKLKPLSLSADALSVNLQIGNQEISYKHGPLLASNFIWPVTDFPQIKIIFVNFNEKEYVENFDGPWSLIKLINMATISNSNEPYHYNLKISNYNYSSLFDLALPNGNVLPMLLELTKLQAPETF